MIRNIKLVWMLVRMKLSHMMVFRLNFFSSFLIDGSMFLLELLVFETLYGNVSSIGGWSRAEMIIFVGTFSMINALNMVIFFFGVLTIPEKIVTGELDHYLTKPMSPLLRITFEQVTPGSIPLIAMSVLIIGYGASQLEMAVTAGQVIGYVFLLILMTVLWYDMEVILRCLPFFFPSASAVADQVEGDLISLNFRVPGTLYKGIYKLIFYFIVPYGIMSTIPTQMLAGMLTPGGFAYGVGIVALFSFLTWLIWKQGLKHYKSASS